MANKKTAKKLKLKNAKTAQATARKLPPVPFAMRRQKSPPVTVPPVTSGQVVTDEDVDGGDAYTEPA